MLTKIQFITDERSEQLTKHGHSIERDVKENADEQLRQGAIELLSKDDWINNSGKKCYHTAMLCDLDTQLWIKMMNKSYRERLIIAGALIAAEIDRVSAIERYSGKIYK
jgi:hypothetical protein